MSEVVSQENWQVDEEEWKELQGRIEAIAIEHAARQPVERLIQLLIYFLVGVSVFLGVFGFQQFSDIANMLDEKIALQFAQDEAKVLAYKNAVDDLRTAHEDYRALIDGYTDALTNLSYLRDVDNTIDLEPTVHRLSDEEDKYAADPSLPGFDSWRLEALTTLELFLQTSSKQNFDPGLLFNAAQMASRLKNKHLSLHLIKEANRRRPLDLASQAAMYSGLIDSGTPNQVEESYAKLMALVPRVVESKEPHIMLSEALNAAADLGRYQEYLSVLQAVDQDGEIHIPSVLYSMKARVLLEVPHPDNLQYAREAILQAKQQLKSETSSNTWVSAALRHISEVERSIRLTEQMRLESVGGGMPSSL